MMSFLLSVYQVKSEKGWFMTLLARDFLLCCFLPIKYSPNTWLLSSTMFAFTHCHLGSTGWRVQHSAALSSPLKLGISKIPTSHRFSEEQHKTVLMVNFLVLSCKVLVSSCGKDHLCCSELYEEVFAKWLCIKNSYMYLKGQNCQGDKN